MRCFEIVSINKFIPSTADENETYVHLYLTAPFSVPAQTNTIQNDHMHSNWSTIRLMIYSTGQISNSFSNYFAKNSQLHSDCCHGRFMSGAHSVVPKLKSMFTYLFTPLLLIKSHPIIAHRLEG